MESSTADTASGSMVLPGRGCGHSRWPSAAECADRFLAIRAANRPCVERGSNGSPDRNPGCMGFVLCSLPTIFLSHIGWLVTLTHSRRPLAYLRMAGFPISTPLPEWASTNFAGPCLDALPHHRMADTWTQSLKIRASRTSQGEWIRRWQKSHVDGDLRIRSLHAFANGRVRFRRSLAAELRPMAAVAGQPPATDPFGRSILCGSLDPTLSASTNETGSFTLWQLPFHRFQHHEALFESFSSVRKLHLVAEQGRWLERAGYGHLFRPASDPFKS